MGAVIQRIATSPTVHTEFLAESGEWVLDPEKARPFATHGQADALAIKLREELTSVLRPDGFRQYTFIHARISERIPQPPAPVIPKRSPNGSANGKNGSKGSKKAEPFVPPPIDAARFGELAREGAVG